jgi:hypothetical protein
MKKLTYLYRMLLFVGIILTAKAMAVDSVKNHSTKKSEITSGSKIYLEVLSKDNLLAEDVDNDIADEKPFKNSFSNDLRSVSYGFCDVTIEAERTVLSKFSVPFYKFSHLFMLFHCWKYLCL